MTIRQTCKIVKSGNSRAINLNHILVRAYNLSEGDIVEIRLKKLTCSDPKPNSIADKSFGAITGSAKVYSQLNQEQRRC